jgi:4-alpha-glucanotransferase
MSKTGSKQCVNYGSKPNALPIQSVQKLTRKAGLCLHFSSLPGPHGIGDMGDAARSFIDFLANAGMQVWQFLPTGPTGFGDSPYQSLSAFAGNPMLIDLKALVRLGLLKSTDLEPLESLPLATVDYGQLIPIKQALLKRAAQCFRQGGFADIRAGFEAFLLEQDDIWLNDYAQYRIIKTLNGDRAWADWKKPLRHREPSAIHKALNQQQQAISDIKFKQYLFEMQWQELKNYASDRGISLFGDMPIYVASDSADAWAHPELLQINPDGQATRVAGVPPDYFSEDGQLWGNPLYDWKGQRDSGFEWWIQRMKRASRHVDLIRVDHFRGFESFWSVPAGEQTARNGRWESGPGDSLFDAIESALGKLPIVAEDLGVITDQVTALRQRHGIPGMRVLQFDINDPDFDPEKIERNTVCYTGTHDNDTVVGWFHGSSNVDSSQPGQSQTQTNALKYTGGSASTIHLDMIRLAFSCPSALAIAPMQDILGLGSAARLNTPGTAGGNWRWRLRKTDLTADLAEQMAELAQATNRTEARP